MRTILLISSVLTLGALTACAPAASTSTTAQYVTNAPVIVHLSPSAAPGQNVTVQGRYLGGPDTATIYLGADAEGKGGYAIPASAVVSWTGQQIVFTLPANAPTGGSFLTVEVGGIRSDALPYNVHP